MKLVGQITYRGGYKYQLQQDGHYFVQTLIRPPSDIKTDYVDLNREGILMIKNGYAWDGPSGPTFDTLNFMRGSVIHDALYQLMRLRKLDRDPWRDVADRTLQTVCIEDGMWRLRAWWVYWAVRLFADPASDPMHEKPPTTAPQAEYNQIRWDKAN